MVQINWGILGNAPDIGSTFMQSFQQGRAAGREKATEDALAAYAAAPSQDALRPLAVLAPQAYAALSRNEREAGQAQREQRARAGYSTYLRENAPTPMGMPQVDALAPPVPSQVNASDEIVVTGRALAPRPQRTVSIADIAADSPELAQQLTSHVGKMSAGHREDLKDYFGTISSVAAEAKRLPYAQRAAFLDAQRDWLSRYGVSSADIDSIDPDDRTLDGLIAIGVGANNVIDNHRADAQFEETQRRNAQSEARAERNDRRSAYYQERNDRRAQVRFSERGLDRAALASSGTGVRTDLSDLDY